MARLKSRTKKDKDIAFLTDVATNNTIAMREGPQKSKRRYTLMDLVTTRPMNETQRQFFEAYLLGNHVIGSGSAGTGKSFISFYLALNDILDEDKDVDRIILVRSAVPSREIGHLPGDVNEKMAVYEEPYKEITKKLLKRENSYTDLKDSGKIVFMPTSFVRGLTWDNAVVIVDEAQSMTFHELNSVITRLGHNSRLIVCGDIAQNDLVTRKNDISGFIRMLKVANNIEEFDIVNFTRDDIVRSKFVKSWICAVEDTPE